LFGKAAPDALSDGAARLPAIADRAKREQASCEHGERGRERRGGYGTAKIADALTEQDAVFGRVGEVRIDLDIRVDEGARRAWRYPGHGTGIEINAIIGIRDHRVELVFIERRAAERLVIAVDLMES